MSLKFILMKKQICRTVFRLLKLALMFLAGSLCAADKPSLPLPKENIPELPPYPPLVVTASGHRFLLKATDAALRFDTATGKLVSNKPGWWFINYPLPQIQGLHGQTVDQISRKLLSLPRLGLPAIKNELSEGVICRLFNQGQKWTRQTCLRWVL